MTTMKIKKRLHGISEARAALLGIYIFNILLLSRIHKVKSTTVDNDRQCLEHGVDNDYSCTCAGFNDIYVWNYSPIADQFEKIITMGKPVKIVSAPAKSWNALQEWKDKEYFLKHAAHFTKVRKKSAKEAFINEEISNPSEIARSLGLLSELTEKYVNMTSYEFFNHMGSNESSLYYAHQFPANEDLKELVHDVNMNDLNINGSDSPGTFIWISLKGTSAVTHYDTAHNFNIQVVGKKKFWLAPAKFWKSMKLFSSFHYSRRQSQWKEIGKNLSDTILQIRDLFKCVILNPGDMLYIPPYYFHAIEVLDDFCINVNSFSKSKLRSFETQLLTTEYINPAVFKNILSSSNSRAYPWAVAYYVWLGLQRTLGEAKQCTGGKLSVSAQKEMAMEVLGVVVDQRLSFFNLCSGFEPNKCPSQLNDLFMSGPEKHQDIRNALDAAIFEMTETVKSYSSQSCFNEGELEIILCDWVEAVLTYSVSIPKGCNFLQCMLESFRAESVKIATM